jgi:hypothetical protein
MSRQRARAACPRPRADQRGSVYRDHEILRYVLASVRLPEGAERVAVSLDAGIELASGQSATAVGQPRRRAQQHCRCHRPRPRAPFSSGKLSGRRRQRPVEFVFVPMGLGHVPVELVLVPMGLGHVSVELVLVPMGLGHVPVELVLVPVDLGQVPVELVLLPMSQLLGTLAQVHGTLAQVHGTLAQVHGTLAQVHGTLAQVHGTLDQLLRGPGPTPRAPGATSAIPGGTTAQGSKSAGCVRTRRAP